MSRFVFKPRLFLGLGLAAAVAFGAWRTGMIVETAAAAGTCAVSSSEIAIDAEEQKMLNGINAYRQQHGLAPLAFSSRLNQAAAWMSHDMAVKRYFSHTDSLGRNPFVRMADCGYTYNTSKGENLAAGYADAASTLNQWKNSSGHNAILLGSSFRAAGIARYYDAGAPYRWYWSLDVGGYSDGSTTPIATATRTPTRTPTIGATSPSGCGRVCTGATPTRTPTPAPSNPPGCRVCY
jgi:uncharacterized protein YkwD